jgi:hypothetical protein
MAAKKTSKNPLSKSDFIRRQPASLSAPEVVARGKAAGITIRAGLVYEVRRVDKAKRGKVKKQATAPTTRVEAAELDPGVCRGESPIDLAVGS